MCLLMLRLGLLGLEKKMGRKEKLIASRWVPKGSMAVRPKGIDAVFYVVDRSSSVQVVVYLGVAGKAAANYAFKSSERAKAYIDSSIESLKRSAAAKGERAAAKKAFVPSLKVGDVLSTSWGYDQTNVEFFQVTKLIGKAMVEVREIAQNSEETGFMCGQCVPVYGKFLNKAPLRKRVLEGNRLDIHNANFGRASLYEMNEVAPGVKVGSPKYWSSYA